MSPRRTTASTSIATATGRSVVRRGSDISVPCVGPHRSTDGRLQGDEGVDESEAGGDHLPATRDFLLHRVLELLEGPGPDAVLLTREAESLFRDLERPFGETKRLALVPQADQLSAHLSLDRHPRLAEGLLLVLQGDARLALGVAVLEVVVEEGNGHLDREGAAHPIGVVAHVEERPPLAGLRELPPVVRD